MTETLAIPYALRRASELGASHCELRHRHLHLAAGEIIKLQAVNELYILLDDVGQKIKVSSDTGEYDFTQEHTNELIHEHSGLIAIENTDTVRGHLQLLQITLIYDSHVHARHSATV